MKGWQILVHSVRLVFGNLDAALRISLVPYLVSGVALALLGLPAVRVMQEGAPEVMAATDPGIWLNYALYMIIYAIAALWIAVAWHRYVLLEEMPNGWMPRFHGGPMLNYFLKGLLIGVLIFIIILAITVVLGFAIGWIGALFPLVMAVITVAAATYIFYRLCPVLPSAAMGKPMSLGDAWEATDEAGSTIFSLVILVLIASLIIQLPSTLGAAGSGFGLIYSFIVNWVSMLVGVSVFTTFYGHYVEGRSID